MLVSESYVVESQINCGKFCFRVMEGLRSNRAVRMHKLVYEALMR